MRHRVKTKAAFAIAIVIGGLVATAAGTATAGPTTCFGQDATITAVAGQVTVGTRGPDVIVGTPGPDTIRGRGGRDIICSGGGDDAVSGGPGNDRMNLGGGNDVANGGAGHDVINAKKGADTVKGGAGNDTIRGNNGADDLEGGRGNDIIRGGNGTDTAKGDAGADIINGGAGLDLCIGGGGDDTLTACNEPRATEPGTHLVPRQMGPGRYIAAATSGCYWERLSGLGGESSDIIANSAVSHDGPQLVDIAETDRAFSFDAECGPFVPYNTPDTAATSMTPGMYVVGADIQPGLYRAHADDGCYWERLRGFAGGVSDIIANDFVAGGGQVLVEVSETDVGFHADGHCGNWERIANP